MSNLLMCAGFSFAIVLTVINKVNDCRMAQASWVKYKIVFCIRRCPRRRRRSFLNYQNSREPETAIIALKSVKCKDKEKIAPYESGD